MAALVLGWAKLFGNACEKYSQRCSFQSYNYSLKRSSVWLGCIFDEKYIGEQRIPAFELNKKLDSVTEQLANNAGCRFPTIHSVGPVPSFPHSTNYLN
jgi:hypothetical protein